MRCTPDGGVRVGAETAIAHSLPGAFFSLLRRLRSSPTPDESCMDVSYSVPDVMGPSLPLPPARNNRPATRRCSTSTTTRAGIEAGMVRPTRTGPHHHTPLRDAAKSVLVATATAITQCCRSGSVSPYFDSTLSPPVPSRPPNHRLPYPEWLPADRIKKMDAANLELQKSLIERMSKGKKTGKRAHGGGPDGKHKTSSEREFVAAGPRGSVTVAPHRRMTHHHMTHPPTAVSR